MVRDSWESLLKNTEPEKWLMGKITDEGVYLLGLYRCYSLFWEESPWTGPVWLLSTFISLGHYV